MTEGNVFSLSITDGQTPSTSIILPTTGPTSFPTGIPKSLLPCPFLRVLQSQAGDPPVPGGNPSPRILDTQDPVTQPRQDWGIHRLGYAWTGYAMGAAPLAFSERSTVLLNLLSVKFIYFSRLKMGKLQIRFQYNQILLVLLFICAAQAKIELRKYRKLRPGQNVTGTIIEELTSKSKLMCSDKSVQYLMIYNSIYMQYICILCLNLVTVYIP